MTYEAAISRAVTGMHSAVTTADLEHVLDLAMEAGLPEHDADVLRREWHSVHAAPRCRCGHGPSAHTRGVGQCWSAVCGCDEYVRVELDPPTRRASIPAHLTGSQRRGGGDPMADYRYLKGEL